MLLPCSALYLSLHSVDRYCGAPRRGAEGGALPDGAQLVSVQLLFRHGDRSSIHALPNTAGAAVHWPCAEESALRAAALAASSKRIDVVHARSKAPLQRPFISSTLETAEGVPRGACAPGQLTTRGASQHVGLGAHFRAAYVTSGVLDGPIYARSTDYRRTMISASAMLSTLVPAPRHIVMEVEVRSDIILCQTVENKNVLQSCNYIQYLVVYEYIICSRCDRICPTPPHPHNTVR